MNEGMKVSLSNPLGTFLGGSVMFLAGIVLGEHWHPSGAVVLAVPFLALCWLLCTNSCLAFYGARSPRGERIVS